LVIALHLRTIDLKKRAGCVTHVLGFTPIELIGMAAAGVSEQDVKLAVSRLDGGSHALHVVLDASIGLDAVSTLANLGTAASRTSLRKPVM
jgi:hypothetical protein